MEKITWIVAALALIAVGEVSGHGRLMDPPARNAMWRVGFQNPVNYNDNEQYCGGFVVHYQKNLGKCGVCGDNYKDKVPRMHEAGGLFGNGIISRRYSMGQIINITADLTTNHKGWMEVKLCPHNNPSKIVAQNCFDGYPLSVVDSPYGDGYQFVIPQESPKVITYTWQAQLPKGLTCSQCIIQWIYYAGNTWGSCTDGSESVGCGDQETFINCADVQINSLTTIIPDELPITPWGFYSNDNSSQHSRPNTHIIRTQLCLPVGKYKKISGMDDWCRLNCMKYNPDCPPHICRCVHTCRAIGEFALKPDADIFCLQNCLGHPSYCPEERCECL